MTRRLPRVVSCLLASLVATVAPSPAEPARAAPEGGGVAGTGLFLAVGYGGRRASSGEGLRWENDTQWSDKAADDDNVLFNVAFGRGKFVAVGGAKVGHILVTRDGKDWREVGEQKGRVATIAFGTPGDAEKAGGAAAEGRDTRDTRDTRATRGPRFVAGHDGEFLYSDDGETWRHGAKIAFEGGIHFRKSACGNGAFVIIGDCDPHWKNRVSCRAVTTDGSDVAQFDSDTPAARAIAFGGPPGAGRFVVVGPDGLRESSADGKHWEHQARQAGEELHSVVWAGDHFLASGPAAAYVSPDGVEWKKQPKGVPCNVLWADAGRKLYLGASWGGHVWTSPDGQAWTKLPLPPGNSFEAIAFGVPETDAKQGK